MKIQNIKSHILRILLVVVMMVCGIEECRKFGLELR